MECLIICDFFLWFFYLFLYDVFYCEYGELFILVVYIVYLEKYKEFDCCIL